jgi:predicted tellurium resistance membrane protein TerC
MCSNVYTGSEMTILTDPQTWISLLTLTILEIVLGIDNVIFIAILAGKLPQEKQGKARSMGLSIALFARVGLLCSIVWLMKLTAPMFTVIGHSISGKDLVLLAGGLFLLWKSVHEIHGSLEGPSHAPTAGGRAKFAAVVGQILVIDIVFSLDSVITAVGLAQEIWVMIAAVVIALAVMLFASGPISDFVNKHPSVKMLALAFLLMVGLMLVAEGMGQHIPKGYIYFAMAFSFAVEMLNLRARAAVEKVESKTTHADRVHRE